MATYSANYVPITVLSFAGLSSQEAGLIDGTKWGTGGYGNGVELTYSFPWADGPAVYSGYGSFRPEWESGSPLEGPERAAVAQVLNDIELAADVTFRLVDDNAGEVGELRFARTANSGYAHAYLPFGESVQSGDVWFSSQTTRTTTEWNPER